MKKKILMGVAALAAFASAAAYAGEVKLGGYYRFEALNENTMPYTLSGVGGDRDASYMWHRLHIKMDMIASEKTHAHMVIRPFDTIVQGANRYSATMNPGTGNNVPNISPNVVAISSNNTNYSGSGFTEGTNWQIRQAWLETEAWGVGIKVGEMPIALHDNILINSDDRSYGAVMLSKAFGPVAVGIANIKVAEGALGSGNDVVTLNGTNSNGIPWTTVNRGSNRDDIDLYALTALGKSGNISYNATLAYAYAGKCSAAGSGTGASTTGGIITDAGSCNGAAGQAIATRPLSYNPTTGTVTSGAGSATDNWWAAITIGADLGVAELTGTVAYEAGYDNVAHPFDNIANTAYTALQQQLDDDGWLGALRAKGKTGFGGWNAYAFYASQGFNSIADKPDWSFNYNGFAGGTDMMSQSLSTRKNNQIQGTNLTTSGNSGNGSTLTVASGGTYVSPTNVGNNLANGYALGSTSSIVRSGNTLVAGSRVSNQGLVSGSTAGIANGGALTSAAGTAVNVLPGGNDGTLLVTDNQNLWGIGAGLTINAGAFKIVPQLDYAHVVKSRYNLYVPGTSNNTGGAINLTDRVNVDSAWGGSLQISTEIDKGTTLTLAGAFVDPNTNNHVNSAMPNTAASGPVYKSDSMHSVGLELNMNF